MQTVSIDELYGEKSDIAENKNSQKIDAQRERYAELKKKFEEKFGDDREVSFFSAPGRCEMIGNHTDHNGGKVVAASIDMDTIAAAAKNGLNLIRISSEGYDDVVVDLSELGIDFLKKSDIKNVGNDETSDERFLKKSDIDNAVNDENADEKILKKSDIEKYSGSAALVAGICMAAVKSGFVVGGFDACITSNVIAAAGVSSSASFEMLICAVINFLFNENMMTENECAHFGQFAENFFWHKSSGLMDQIACAVGGAVYMDFGDIDNVKFEKTQINFEDFGYSIVIVNTGKGHADLSREYSSIPEEMFEVANRLGANRLCEIGIEKVLENVSDIDNDRALLRAIHFFNENERVEKMFKSLESGNVENALCMMNESGRSSWELLQNCYCNNHPEEQKISLALALTERFFGMEQCKKIFADSGSTHTAQAGRTNDDFALNMNGICRVHGGGFAGVIMAVVPNEWLSGYVEYIAGFFGRENVHPIRVRAFGAVNVLEV